MASTLASSTPRAATRRSGSSAVSAPPARADAAPPVTSPLAPAAVPAPGAVSTAPRLAVENLHIYYGDAAAVREATVAFPDRAATALIGPSGSGKSTLLRAINRMHELTPGTRTTGAVHFDGVDLLAADPVLVRRRVGMVFQTPNPFPKSIRANVLWGAGINGYTGETEELLERSLRQAALWDEVKDRLDSRATGLSGGQQQRLCIARALAVEPDVLLMDEPTSALDPRSTSLVEETVKELAQQYTVVIVTHNLGQAQRVAAQTAFLLSGEVIEVGPTAELFEQPRRDETRDYVQGRFG